MAPGASNAPRRLGTENSNAPRLIVTEANSALQPLWDEASSVPVQTQGKAWVLALLVSALHRWKRKRKRHRRERE